MIRREICCEQASIHFITVYTTDLFIFVFINCILIKIATLNIFQIAQIKKTVEVNKVK